MVRQIVDGTVWLDLDRNGVRGPREVGVPGVQVELRPIATRLVGGGGGGLGRMASVVLHLETTTGEPVFRTTDGSGAFSFGAVPVGAYRVVVRQPAKLAVTYDSDGPLDASADIDVPEGQDRDAHVGLVGDASVAAQVLHAGVPVSGDVVLRWAGVNDVLGDDDDLLLPVTVVHGRLGASGLPAGTYVVETTDGSATSGALELAPGERYSTDVDVADSASPPGSGPVPSPVPSSGSSASGAGPVGSAPGPAVEPAVARAAGARALAVTGSSAGTAGAVAGLLLGAGSLLVLLARRRGRAPRHRA